MTVSSMARPDCRPGWPSCRTGSHYARRSRCSRCSRSGRSPCCTYALLRSLLQLYANGGRSPARARLTAATPVESPCCSCKRPLHARPCTPSSPYSRRAAASLNPHGLQLQPLWIPIPVPTAAVRDRCCAPCTTEPPPGHLSMLTRPRFPNLSCTARPRATPRNRSWTATTTSSTGARRWLGTSRSRSPTASARRSVIHCPRAGWGNVFQWQVHRPTRH